MDDLMGLESAVERLNEGAPLATMEAYLVERMWEALSRIRREEGQHAVVGMVGARLDPGLAPPTPEQKLAMTARYALLNALVEAGVLDEYMSDEASRKKVFRVAALLPCDKNDLYEAVTERTLRQSSADVGQKWEEELKLSGCDREHLNLADKFIAWMRDSG